VAGLDVSSKLRRGLGQGQVLSIEAITKQLSAFDADKDGALTRPEIVAFLKKHNAGGAWFCEWVAHNMWDVFKKLAGQDPAWVKIDMLAQMVHFTMQAKPRPARRVKITPESAVGYEPLEWLDGKGGPPPKIPSVYDKDGPAVKPPSRPAGGPGPGAPGGAPSAQPSSGAPAGRAGPAPRGRTPPQPGGRPGPAPRGAAPAPRRPGPGQGPRR
jgi:hypothetical protein